MSIRNSHFGAASSYLLVHQCVDDWLGHSPSTPYSSRSLVSGGEGVSYKHSRDEGGSAHLECLPSQDPGRDSCSHKQCHSGGFSEASGRYFHGDVQSGTGDHGLDRTALGDLVCKMHSGEEEYSSGPVELSRPGPSLRVISSSLGV